MVTRLSLNMGSYDGWVRVGAENVKSGRVGSGDVVARHEVTIPLGVGVMVLGLLGAEFC